MTPHPLSHTWGNTRYYPIYVQCTLNPLPPLFVTGCLIVRMKTKIPRDCVDLLSFPARCVAPAWVTSPPFSYITYTCPGTNQRNQDSTTESLSSAATVRMVGRAVSAPQWLTARWSVVVGALVVLPQLVAGQQAVDLGTASSITKPKHIGGGGG